VPLVSLAVPRAEHAVADRRWGHHTVATEQPETLDSPRTRLLVLQYLGVDDPAERETRGASRVTGRVGDDDRMTLRKALEAGIERADEDGATKVKARHFHESEIDQILSACFDFLEAKTAGPSLRFNSWLVTSGSSGAMKAENSACRAATLSSRWLRGACTKTV
jgi:hypothetical protein